MILPKNIDDLPISNVSEFVGKLAKAHDIKHTFDGMDRFAQSILDVLGDDVTLDQTARLLIELRKKKIISDAQLSRLVVNHFEAEA